MRHLKAHRRLGVSFSHRNAMLKNLATSLLEHGRIKTTQARAKELRPYTEKLITLAKKDSLHTRRLALKKIKTKDAFLKLFNEYRELYSDRSGGYTRIYSVRNRLGDNAPMAIIEMVDYQSGLSSVDTEEAAEKVKEEKKDMVESIKNEVGDTESNSGSALTSSKMDENKSQSDSSEEESSENESDTDSNKDLDSDSKKPE